MNKVTNQITFDQAKKQAENAVMSDIAHYENIEVCHPLEDEYFEAECCWIFLRNKKIIVLPTHWFTKEYGAYAVSKKGAFSQIMNFANDTEQLKTYVQIMSDYFKATNE